VAEAGSGEEAVQAALAHAPDVVLMDIRMPEMDGVDATRRLPAATSRTHEALGDLTDREEQVLRMLAIGQTNAEIA